MGNIIPTTEYAPQVPQEDFIPVAPTLEAPPVVQEEVKQETQPVTTNKATLIQQSNDAEPDVTKAETLSPSYGYSRPEGQQSESDNLDGNFMSSLVFDKGNHIPVTQ
ncbi:MAG TPA: hypothetical protein VJY47_02930 [Candidatus Dojkabacteria bacterium]|nr:hypothetical protein [Candidatus Dojkabacteria bacterium]